jgi:RNA polymerase sigma-70 factor (ECF subfamily)
VAVIALAPPGKGDWTRPEAIIIRRDFNETAWSHVLHYRTREIDVTTGELALPFRDESARTREAYEQCVATHRQRVLLTAYRLVGTMQDAQDVAQEVFLRLFQNMGRIEGEPLPWLYRVTLNVCRDQLRRRKRRPESEHEAEREWTDPAPGPHRILELDERKRLLMAALERLPDRERAAVVLRDIEGLSTREAAEVLGVEEGTVRCQVSMARLKLAKYVRAEL